MSPASSCGKTMDAVCPDTDEPVARERPENVLIFIVIDDVTILGRKSVRHTCSRARARRAFTHTAATHFCSRTFATTMTVAMKSDAMTATTTTRTMRSFVDKNTPLTLTREFIASVADASGDVATADGVVDVDDSIVAVRVGGSVVAFVTTSLVLLLLLLNVGCAVVGAGVGSLTGVGCVVGCDDGSSVGAYVAPAGSGVGSGVGSGDGSGVVSRRYATYVSVAADHRRSSTPREAEP